MSRYVVVVHENARYMDASAEREHGRFDSYEAAEAACRRLVDVSLEEHLCPGITADALFKHYMLWGDDPYIVGGPPGHFSAWDYARARCRVLCAGGAP